MCVQRILLDIWHAARTGKDRRTIAKDYGLTRREVAVIQAHAWQRQQGHLFLNGLVRGVGK
jgi:hypothetical protein